MWREKEAIQQLTIKFVQIAPFYIENYLIEVVQIIE